VLFLLFCCVVTGVIMAFLLERLAARPASPDGRIEEFDELAAIQAQVQRLFIGRTVHARGASGVLRWGLPNVIEMGNRDMRALQGYAEQARRLILQHEPRLKDVVVTVEPQNDPLVPVRMIVSAALADGGDACSFQLTLTH
jgi:predicted component of type VI protein secretion system